MTPILQCTRVTKKFGSFTAVSDVDLVLRPGSVLGFIGPNGAGKSTTIRMLLGLSAPTSGSVTIFGSDPLRDVGVRARIGYSPGELRLDDRLTVSATLQSWERLRGGVDTAYRNELIERLGVQLDRHVRGLSTGNRRKLALVGALMGRPELLILDEPTNGLDPLVQMEFMALLEEAVARGASVMLSSHILSEVERIADRVAVIRAGNIVAEGSTGDLRREVAQEFRAVFAGAVTHSTGAASTSAASALASAREAIAALEGTKSLELREPAELRIRWIGEPRPLLQVLAEHNLVSLTAPEPDLESAFMSYYRAGSEAANPGRAS